MSVVISFVLACTTILATFMLQLCDDNISQNGPIVSVVSLILISIALYFVDLRKKFSLSQPVVNMLILLAVAAQIFQYLHSRQEFLAFSIANILASIPAFLFFRRKSIRICYQILSISFVEVAVGCVFQRSSLFVAALPVYSILAFSCFSLLFLWNERKYYAERVELKQRFSGNKNLDLISREDVELQASDDTPHEIDCAAAQEYAQISKSVDPALFFRRTSSQKIRFDGEFFRRFFIYALKAWLFASVFFCLFPRLDQFGFGALRFEDVSWNNIRGAGATKTGFHSSIELGDLGPSVKSHERVMDIKLFNLSNPNLPFAVNPQAPLYFRGIALASYKDKIWREHDPHKAHDSAFSLVKAIKQTSCVDPNLIVPVEIQEADGQNKFGLQDLPASSPYPQPQGNNYLMFRPTFFPEEPAFCTRQFHSRVFEGDVTEKEVVQKLVEYCAEAKDDMLFDVRSEFVAMKVKLHQLDVPTIFTPDPFLVLDCTVNLHESNGNGTQIDSRRYHPRDNYFWFLTPAFQNERQMEFTPNHELVWTVLDQYLQIDRSRFPRLIALAQEWDRESGLPQEDFVARARYLEAKFRDSGEFHYNRLGVSRPPETDPLEDFVSEQREGHCEYFAGALALTLRAIGIPARVVVGYACYPSKNGNEATVLQSDAHSWVEAYIPEDKLPKSNSGFASLLPEATTSATSAWRQDGAWLRLDATPAADRDAERPDILALGIYNWSNFFKHFGRDFVMNFNGTRQMQNVYGPIVRLCKSVVAGIMHIKELFSGVARVAQRFLETTKNLFEGKWSSEVVVRFILFLSLGAFAIYLIIRLSVWLTSVVKSSLARNKNDGLQNASKRNESSATLYRQLEKAFENRLNITRSASETSREFLERCFSTEDALSNDREPDVERSVDVTPENDRKRLREFIERYYRAYYGDVALTSEENDQWQNVLRNVGVL